MQSRDFCFWLQGYFEITSASSLSGKKGYLGMSPEETEVVKKHLALVFKHEIDPPMGDKSHQQQLNEIHEYKKTTALPSKSWTEPKIRC